MGVTRRVVIVGAGFGGLSAARALAGPDVEVEVVDRRNHHLFQPLLYQVATAGLEPSDIAYAVRGIVRKERGVRFTAADIVGVPLLDHVVVAGRGGGWCSMLELGLLNTKENPDERTEHPTPRQRAAESQ